MSVLNGLSCHRESGVCSFYYLGHTHLPLLEEIINANQTSHVLNIF